MKPIGQIKNFMHENAVVGFTKDTALSILELMSKYHIRHVPVLDTSMNLYRIVTDKDILDLLWKSPTMDVFRMSIDKMTQQKVITMHPEDDISTAIRIMTENKISCLPIITEDDIVGILTVRDILSIDPLWDKIENPSLNPYDDGFGFKIQPDYSITQDYSLWQILDKLTNTTTRNLLVYERNMVTGLVSTLTLISEIIEFNRRLFHIQRKASFDEYLFTTSLEDILVEHPVFAKAPIYLNEIRDLMITHNTTAILLGNRKHPLRIITERDLFQFLDKNYKKSTKSHIPI